MPLRYNKRRLNKVCSKRTKERKGGKRKVADKESGNLTISACNEASGLFGAKASGTLWVVGVRLCGIGEVVETRGALKLEGKKEK